MNKLISAVFEVNGEIVTIGESQGAPAVYQPVNDDDYAEDGFTKDMTLGCVGSKVVDAHLALMAIGNEYEQAVAEKAARMFAVIVPGRAYDEATKVDLHRNYQQDNDSFTSGWLGGWMFEPFYPGIERQPDGQVKGVGEGMEGFRVPIFGFNPNVVHKKFEAAYIADLNRGAAAMQTAAENPNAPKVSPRG